MDYMVYWVFFLVGTAYAVVSAIFAGIGHLGVEGGDVGHDVDVGHDFDVDVGHDFDVAHDLDIGHDIDFDADLDVGHDIDVGHHADLAGPGDVDVPAVSPITIGAFLSTCGGSGIILKLVLDLHPALVGLFSFGIGFLGAFLVYLIIRKMVIAFQSSSEANLRELIGISAEIITPISAGGIGEIAYVAKGSRYVAPARSGDDRQEIDRGSTVRVKRIIGSTFYVAPVKKNKNEK
jgi:hypothetical protein